MNETYTNLCRIIGAAHKRIGKDSRFPQDMIHDLYIQLYGSGNVKIKPGKEAIYCRKWIDGWVKTWYYESAISRPTDAAIQLDKKVIAQESAIPLDQFTRNILMEYLDLLKDRHREVICLRFGLGDGYIYTLSEVASRFNCSVGNILSIQSTALRKLRRMMASRGQHYWGEILGRKVVFHGSPTIAELPEMELFKDRKESGYYAKLDELHRYEQSIPEEERDIRRVIERSIVSVRSHTKAKSTLIRDCSKKIEKETIKLKEAFALWNLPISSLQKEIDLITYKVVKNKVNSYRARIAYVRKRNEQTRIRLLEQRSMKQQVELQPLPQPQLQPPQPPRPQSQAQPHDPPSTPGSEKPRYIPIYNY